MRGNSSNESERSSGNSTRPSKTTTDASLNQSTRTSSSSTSTLDALRKLVTAVQTIEFSLKLPYADALDLHDAMTNALAVITIATNERKVNE